MSIYSSKLNTIFVQVPRTASSSMAELVGGQGHRDIIYFKRFFGGQSDLNFKDIFKFAFVRDPYTRFVSCFQWLQENYPEYKDINEFANILKKEYSKWPDDDLREIMYRPQHKFICNQYYTPQVDFVGRFENLKDDWGYVADKLGITKKLPHNNKSTIKKPTLTSQTKDLIREIYEKDFEVFGYKL